MDIKHNELLSLIPQCWISAGIQVVPEIHLLSIISSLHWEHADHMLPTKSLKKQPIQNSDIMTFCFYRKPSHKNLKSTLSIDSNSTTILVKITYTAAGKTKEHSKKPQRINNQTKAFLS